MNYKTEILEKVENGLSEIKLWKCNACIFEQYNYIQ